MSLYAFPASECTPFSTDELKALIAHLDKHIFDGEFDDIMLPPYAYRDFDEYRPGELSSLIEAVEHLEPPSPQELYEEQQRGYGAALALTWELALLEANPKHWKTYKEFFEDTKKWKKDADDYLVNLELILQEDRKRRREREYYRLMLWPNRFTYRDPQFALTTAERQSTRHAMRSHPYFPVRPQEPGRQVHFTFTRNTPSEAIEIAINAARS